MKLLLLFSLLTVFVLTASTQSNLFNKIIDSILAKRKSEPGDLDPIKIDDKGIDFERKVGFVKVHGIAKFRNISIEGLSQLKREGDVTTEKLSEEKNRMTVHIEISNLKAHMEGVIKFMGVGIVRQFSGTIEKVKGEAQLILDKPNDKLELSKFKLTDKSGLVLKVEGSFVIVDSITNYVIKTAVNTFNTYFGYGIEFSLNRLFADTVAKSDALKKAMVTIN